MTRTLGRTVASLLGSVICAAAVGILVPQPAYAAVDPLSDYVPVASMKVSEDIDENWTFNTHTPYWSVLAVAPPAGWDVVTDVGFDGSGFVRSSTNGQPGPGFVAIDSNGGRRPYGQYFARGITLSPPDWPGGALDYTIMVAQGYDIVRAGTTQINWDNGRFVVVRDIFLWAGQQVTVSTSWTDLVYLFGSDPADSSTWVQPRESASAQSTWGWLDYTAPRSAWYGLVVLNQSGASASTVDITTS